MDRLEEQLAGVQRADEALQELEAGDTALEACLEKIAEMMSLFPDARQTDWDKVIAEKKGRLQTATERLKDCDAVLKQAEQELKNRTDGWEQFKKEYAAFCEAYRISPIRLRRDCGKSTSVCATCPAASRNCVINGVSFLPVLTASRTNWPAPSPVLSAGMSFWWQNHSSTSRPA